MTTLLRVVMHIFGMGDDTASIRKGLLVTAGLIPFLVDLSCAYPPRRTMERCGIAPEEFEPGLKLGRLLLALHRADLEQTTAFMRAVEADDYAAAEPILLRHCPVSYLPSAQIYRDWVDELDEAQRRWNDPVLRVRRQAAELRLKEPHRFVNKRFSEILFAPLPLL